MCETDIQNPSSSTGRSLPRILGETRQAVERREYGVPPRALGPAGAHRCWSLSQDGADEDGAEGSPAGKNQGLCKGLLQEEWPAHPLGYRRDDGMPAGISPQVAQPVHTGKDKWMV